MEYVWRKQEGSTYKCLAYRKGWSSVEIWMGEVTIITGFTYLSYFRCPCDYYLIGYSGWQPDQRRDVQRSAGSFLLHTILRRRCIALCDIPYQIRNYIHTTFVWRFGDSFCFFKEMNIYLTVNWSKVIVRTFTLLQESSAISNVPVQLLNYALDQ